MSPQVRTHQEKFDRYMWLRPKDLHGTSVPSGPNSWDVYAGKAIGRRYCDPACLSPTPPVAPAARAVGDRPLQAGGGRAASLGAGNLRVNTEEIKHCPKSHIKGDMLPPWLFPGTLQCGL